MEQLSECTSQKKYKWPVNKRKKMFNIFIHQENKNQNYNEISFYPSWNDYYKKIN